MKKPRISTDAGQAAKTEETVYPAPRDHRPRPHRSRRQPRVRDCTFARQFYLLPHAQLRATQRGLTRADIDYVLCHGWLSHAGEAEIYFLRAVDIPQQDHSAMSRLEGTAVIVARQRAQIITVWRNRQHGARNIRRKLAQVWRRDELAEEVAMTWRHTYDAVA